MTDDRALVLQVLQGDTEAFRRLIKLHERLVAHMIGRLIKNSEDREELCQDVFLKVFDKMKEFHFQSKLSTWIATIAYHHAINHLRKKKLLISDIAESEQLGNKFISHDNPGEQLENQDMEDKIRSYIEELPVHYKTILSLYHLEGMSYPEIGQVTGLPDGTVKNYLFRARNLLKEKVKKYLGTEAQL